MKGTEDRVQIKYFFEKRILRQITFSPGARRTAGEQEFVLVFIAKLIDEATRKLILKMSISVDGFVEGPNGKIDWLLRTLDEEPTTWIPVHFGK
jgi:hypothetical protein